MAGGVSLPKKRFAIVPAGDGLNVLERKEAMHTPYARAFRAFLKQVDTDFDVCVVDTHPSPDIRMISALASADFVLSPIQLNQESVDGVRALLLHPRVGVLKIKAMLNQKLHFIGLLPTLVEPTNFQRANFRVLVERHLDLMIRINAERPGPHPQAHGDRRGAGRRPGPLGDQEAHRARCLGGDQAEHRAHRQRRHRAGGSLCCSTWTVRSIPASH
jgi:hypothetical protein